MTRMPQAMRQVSLVFWESKMTGDRGGNTEVIVIGGGGHAKVVVATLLDCGLDVRAVWDDDPEKSGTTLLGVSVVQPPAALPARKIHGILAVGDNQRRQLLARRFCGLDWVTAIHPRAYVHPSVTVGNGTLVTAGAIVQPDSIIGEHVIINTGASIDHDCTIGGFVHVAPGARIAGSVRLEEGALFGIGSVVKPGTTIGKWATVGAGAAVIRDVQEGHTVAGVPARPLP